MFDIEVESVQDEWSGCVIGWSTCSANLQLGECDLGFGYSVRIEILSRCDSPTSRWGGRSMEGRKCNMEVKSFLAMLSLRSSTPP